MPTGGTSGRARRASWPRSRDRAASSTSAITSPAKSRIISSSTSFASTGTARPSPASKSPVGDFFGVGFGFSERVNSALMCIDQRPGKLTDPAAMGAARNCYIPMPFARAARITLTNEGKQSSRHWVEINYRTYKNPPPDQLYFHAQYRQGTPPPEGPYLILDAKGRGHLVGCVLSVKNNDGGWWGEGDEIAWIDGKHAIQGTGSEDYFCESYGLRGGLLSLFRRHATGGAVYHGLSLACAGPGGVSRVAAIPDRAGRRQPALPQRQLLLQRGLLVSDRAPSAFSEAAQRGRANKLGRQDCQGCRGRRGHEDPPRSGGITKIQTEAR